ncbi:MAG: PadR family transcriptional regulator [Candidatus Aminicenantes bacterium]|nr:PadR family transcriptional regulator [Candidatus Aminicenantes bacterium]MDH5707431.1 PadR family transcriptional regulator [Candidatus Aminicenantes bacterium]
MKSLTRKEELIMLSILHMKKNAYLVAIVDHLSQTTEKKVSLTSVHLPLNRIEKKGLIASEFGEATAVRGGRRKKIYTITKLGFEVLEEHKRITDLLWKNYMKYSSPKD